MATYRPSTLERLQLLIISRVALLAEVQGRVLADTLLAEVQDRVLAKTSSLSTLVYPSFSPLYLIVGLVRTCPSPASRRVRLMRSLMVVS